MSYQGSTEDILSKVCNPTYQFNEQKIPSGSPAFQMVVTDFSDKTDSEEKEVKRPSLEYMKRRRNTVAVTSMRRDHSPGLFGDRAQFRRGSIMPGYPALNLQLSDSSRPRTASPGPLSRELLARKHSIQDEKLPFGRSKKERDYIIR